MRGAQARIGDPFGAFGQPSEDVAQLVVRDRQPDPGLRPPLAQRLPDAGLRLFPAEVGGHALHRRPAAGQPGVRSCPFEDQGDRVHLQLQGVGDFLPSLMRVTPDFGQGQLVER